MTDPGSARAHPATVGDGRYEIGRLLGKGSRKRVYLGRDRRLDRRVAVAIVDTDGLDAATLGRVRAEARAMAKLGDHPNVVPVYDTGEEPGRVFIVSQFMAGGDMQRRLDEAPEQRLPLADALRIGESVCRALAHAHRHGIVHRDLKPANVWLTDDGTAKLGDFGIALTATGAHPTAPGAVVGTPAYMSPEQALGDVVDARSDLYALGALQYQLVTGAPPFVADDALAVLSQHIHAPPSPPSARAPSVPRALDDLILELLAKARDDRPSSADAVAARLHALAATVEGDARSAATLDVGLAAARPGRRASLTPGRVIAMLLVVGVVAASLRRLVPHDHPTALPPESQARLVIGVMEFAGTEPGPDVDRMRQSTRDSLNTILSNVDGLRVYAKEMIDFKREKLGLREIEVAQRLGITKMISGTLSTSGAAVTIEARVVDIRTGFLDASIRREQPRTRLIELQNDVAQEILESLHVPLPPGRLEHLFADRRNETLADLNRLYDALGDVVGESGERPPAVQPPPPPGSWLFDVASAYADEVPAGSDEQKIRALLEDYRSAFEARDVDRLAGLQLEMTDAQRAALARYFENTRELTVRIFDVEVVVKGDEALASYGRLDSFRDARSGQTVRLEVRLNLLLARRGDGWRIRGRK